MKPLLRIVAVLVGIFPLAARPAYAGDPCAADVQRYCRNAKSGPEIIACLAQNEGRLNPACQELRRGAREHTRQEWGGAMTACGRLTSTRADVIARRRSTPSR